VHGWQFTAHELDAKWDDVIRACLHRQRNQRPASAADVAKALGL